jgi:hypothetical protein
VGNKIGSTGMEAHVRNDSCCSCLTSSDLFGGASGTPPLAPVGGGVEEEPPDYSLEVKHEHDNSRSIEPHVPVAGDNLSGDKRQLRSKSHEEQYNVGLHDKSLLSRSSIVLKALLSRDWPLPANDA